MKKTPKRILIPLLIVLLGTLIGTFMVVGTLRYLTGLGFETCSKQFLDDMQKPLEEREQVLEETFQYNDRVNAQLLYNMSFVFEEEVGFKQEGDLRNEYEIKLMEMKEKTGLDGIYITDAEGNVYLCSDVELNGKNLPESLGLEAASWVEIRDSEIDENSKYRYGYGITAPDGTGKAVYSFPIFSDDDTVCSYFVGVSNEEFMQEITEDSRDLTMFFEPLVAYDELSAFAVDAETKTVWYASRDLKDLIGKTLSELEIPETAKEADGQVFDIRVDGKKRSAITRHFSFDGVGDWIIYSCEPDTITAYNRAVVWIALVFLIGGFLFFFTMNACRGSGKMKMRRNALVTAITVLVMVAAASYYIASMAMTSLAMEQINVNGEAFIKSYNANIDMSESVQDYYENRSLTTLDTLITYIENYEDDVLADVVDAREYYVKRTEEGKKEYVKDIFGNDLSGSRDNHTLQFLASDIGADRLQILNGDGKTIGASDDQWYYELSTGDLGYEEQLGKVLDHKASGFYRLFENKEDGCVEEVYALPIRIFMKQGPNGETVILSAKEYKKAVQQGTEGIIVDNGLILAHGTKPVNVYRSETQVAVRTMENMRTAQESRIALVDTAEQKVKSCTTNISEADVISLGFLETYAGKNSYRFSKLNGEKVFAGIVDCLAPNALITVLPKKDLMSGTMLICSISTLYILLLLLVLNFYFIKNEPVMPEESAEPRKLIMPQGDRQYRGFREYLTRLDPHAKTVLFVKCCFLAAFLILVIRLVVLQMFGSDDLAFRYTMSENWERGVHLFSVSYVVFIALSVLTLIALAQTIVKYLVPILGSGTETMVRLVLSVTEYVGIIVLIFYSMYLFGVQMGTVLTSASIVSIVVGLGANSLISDVLAGVFIIIEQEYKVGDIITIDNFTGFVRSIGLRTTKVQDFSGNIKTFNNAKISGVLNLTDNYTTFFVNMGIHIDVPVEEIEQIVNLDLKERLKDDPDLVAGPWFSGIPEVKGNVYTISIGASSLQQRYWSLRKRIIQEMLILMKEKGIRMS